MMSHPSDLPSSRIQHDNSTESSDFNYEGVELKRLADFLEWEVTQAETIHTFFDIYAYNYRLTQCSHDLEQIAKVVGEKFVQTEEMLCKGEVEEAFAYGCTLGLAVSAQALEWNNMDLDAFDAKWFDHIIHGKIVNNIAAFNQDDIANSITELLERSYNYLMNPADDKADVDDIDMFIPLTTQILEKLEFNSDQRYVFLAAFGLVSASLDDVFDDRDKEFAEIVKFLKK